MKYLNYGITAKRARYARAKTIGAYIVVALMVVGFTVWACVRAGF